jgi:hypothetical protein
MAGVERRRAPRSGFLHRAMNQHPTSRALILIGDCQPRFSCPAMRPSANDLPSRTEIVRFRRIRP